MESRFRAATKGDVLFDRFSRGRYATDASFYQMMPVGVVVPRDEADLGTSLAIAREEGLTVLPRGGGTSQSGQTVNESLVLDTAKHLNRIVEIDAANRRCVVQPGIVLDELNRVLKPHGLWFPVDVSTASRATIGGMAGNNSCGTRSIRYGTMRDNVLSIDALLPDGRPLHFGPVARSEAMRNAEGPDSGLFRDLLALGEREAAEIEARFPKVLRRVGGYNIDALVPNGPTSNLAHLLVGSEGTLALSTQLELKLSPLLGARTVGVCHFARFYDAMEAAQHLVTLDPVAVELVDRTMIGLARDIDIFRSTVEAFVRGEPDALLIVEFAENDPAENRRRLKRLVEMMGDLGFGWDRSGRHWGGVVEIEDPSLQAAITEVRQSGLNIMMSMKSEGKPVSFVEDCAVPLEHLAEFTDRLTQIFEKHGTSGTWYAHASVGCLHVRPILNLKLDKDVKAMRGIAEEAFAMVRAYKGSHSGEHGDGLVRSEFHAPMFGERLVRAFEEVKDRFDPERLLNPGKIVRPPKMDDRRLFRYGPDYRIPPLTTALDWSAWPGAGGGFQGAVEMCNNNGACRNLAGGVMCPSYRATRDERDVTRGRANTLRLAISGQLGPDALASDDMMETLKLCVSCKACRRECPTGVDMARMKIEVLAARAAKGKLSLRDRLVAYLPRYAPLAAKAPWLMNMRDRIPGMPLLSEKVAGFSARRAIAGMASRSVSPRRIRGSAARAAARSCSSRTPSTPISSRRTCGPPWRSGGGRLSHSFPQGRPKRARVRSAAAGHFCRPALWIRPARRQGALWPHSCPSLRAGSPWSGSSRAAFSRCGTSFPPCCRARNPPALPRMPCSSRSSWRAKRARDGLTSRSIGSTEQHYLHGHCHQKAFGAMQAVEAALKLVPGLTVKPIVSSCCGMAGAFGYQAETYDTSLAMGEISLLPAVRAAESDAIVVADGTSCRQQIQDGTGRKAIHVARVLELAISAPVAISVSA